MVIRSSCPPMSITMAMAPRRPQNMHTMKSDMSGAAAVKTLTIPSTVSANGKKYKVTAVSANACKGLKKLKTVTIGKYVTKIGSAAFSGDKKLKSIVIKSSKLKTVGKNAIKGIYKKAVIKAPGKQLKKYKKLFSAKTGFKKTMKIKK